MHGGKGMGGKIGKEKREGENWEEMKKQMLPAGSNGGFSTV